MTVEKKITKVISKMFLNFLKSHVNQTYMETKCWVITWGFDLRTPPYVTSFRRRFFAYHHTVKQPHTNIILS